jgi:hypothetical protein
MRGWSIVAVGAVSALFSLACTCGKEWVELGKLDTLHDGEYKIVEPTDANPYLQQLTLVLAGDHVTLSGAADDGTIATGTWRIVEDPAVDTGP